MCRDQKVGNARLSTSYPKATGTSFKREFVGSATPSPETTTGTPDPPRYTSPNKVNDITTCTCIVVHVVHALRCIRLCSVAIVPVNRHSIRLYVIAINQHPEPYTANKKPSLVTMAYSDSSKWPMLADMDPEYQKVCPIAHMSSIRQYSP